MDWQIENGLSLIDGGWSEAPLALRGMALGEPEELKPGACRLDASGLLVLPGIVDVHGDAFERQIMPRPGVRFDTELALRDTDRQLVMNGITTAFHGVTVSWEPGLRSVEAARAFIEVLQGLRQSLCCDTHLHLRWETFAIDAASEVAEWLALSPPPILAFNDHTTGSVLKGAISRKLGQWAERAGLSPVEYEALMNEVWSRREEVPAVIASLAASARERGNVLLAHDEASPQQRARFRELGAVSCEFPLTPETAEAARVAGEDVILGAPNVVRGGSHNGALDAAKAIEAGQCTILTSDYHYPSPLHAAFKVAGGKFEGLARSWPLVSANPARAMRLDDRGELLSGRRADVILVDDAREDHPEVLATIVAGRIVHAGPGLYDRFSPAMASAAE